MAGPRQIGEWIADRYEIFEVHRGGMSLVYVAHDHLGDPGRNVVALKTAREELIGDSGRCARFATECGVWVRLGEHPNIVRALDVVESEGKPYVVLELVTGGDLRRWIGRPRLTLPRALDFGVQFCLGLEHALRQGLECHRDVKPGNLLVTADGILKITDFGLARLRDELRAHEPVPPSAPIPLDDTASPRPTQEAERSEPAEATGRGPGPAPEVVEEVCGADAETEVPSDSASTESSPAYFNPGFDAGIPLVTTIDWRPSARSPRRLDLESSRLTGTGLILGTIPYMAPEQFEDAKSADVRADIYAFGVVLFEMIAGRRPFQGNTVGKLRRQHARADPPPIAPLVPRRFAREADRIDQVVRHCLAKDPADRFESVADLRQALRHVQRQVGRP